MSAHPNAALIERFYRAFAAKDAQAMAECYHPEARFSDPVFPELSHDEVCAMWAMFCRPGGDLRIAFSDVSADDATGRAHWDAWYTFPKTGRKVVNRIDASFELKDGKIFRHRDSFDFWKWSRQSLGPMGALFGWTPMARNGVRQGARASLDAFIAQSRQT